MASAAARAQDGDSWRVEAVRSRVAYFDQEGWGAQSQANPQVIDGVERGSERLHVWQPTFQMVLRQNESVQHQVTIPVDIVTSASADALDAVSSASRVNEAVEFDIRTAWRPTEDDQLEFRYGAHIEEYLKGGFGGLAYTRELADDNATLSLRADMIVDVFDPLSPQGFDSGLTNRNSFHASLSGSQILSPTTLVLGSYDLTYQWGRLEQTWNSVPTDRSAVRPAELFPDHRLRHALSGEIAQHIPVSRSTLRGRYRYYRDDFGIRGHTFEIEGYQWIGRRMYLRVGYRLHDQTAPDFFTTYVPAAATDSIGFRTADSDLAPFRAHEWNIKVALYTSLDEHRGRESISVSYHRYDRPFLDVGVMSVGYSWER
ncbi:MAG: DUF3570 domain-containing protein [Myxococcota bacterium]